MRPVQWAVGYVVVALGDLVIAWADDLAAKWLHVLAEAVNVLAAIVELPEFANSEFALAVTECLPDLQQKILHSCFQADQVVI